jgi:hypothetical protein
LSSGRGRGGYQANRGNFWDHGRAAQRRASVPDAVVNGKLVETSAATAGAAMKADNAFEKEQREKEAANTRGGSGFTYAAAAAAYKPAASASGGNMDRPSTAPDKSVASRIPKSVRTKSDNNPPNLSHSSSRESLGGSGRSSVSVAFGGSSNGTSPSYTPRSGASASPTAAVWGEIRPVTPFHLNSAAGLVSFRAEGDVIVSEEHTAKEQADVEADILAERMKFPSFSKGKPQSVRSASDSTSPNFLLSGESPRTPNSGWSFTREDTPRGAQKKAVVLVLGKAKEQASGVAATAALKPAAEANGKVKGDKVVQASVRRKTASKETDLKEKAASNAKKADLTKIVFAKYAYNQEVVLESDEAVQINFSQRSVSNLTNDGKGIETLYGRFFDEQEGEVPAINVIHMADGSLMSYDNRRLVAYRLALRHRADAKIKVVFRHCLAKSDGGSSWNDLIQERLQKPREAACGETEIKPLPSEGVAFNEVFLRKASKQQVELCLAANVETLHWHWDNNK